MTQMDLMDIIGKTKFLKKSMEVANSNYGHLTFKFNHPIILFSATFQLDQLMSADGRYVTLIVAEGSGTGGISDPSSAQNLSWDRRHSTISTNGGIFGKSRFKHVWEKGRRIDGGIVRVIFGNNLGVASVFSGEIEFIQLMDEWVSQK